jgi:hypothetical protein
MDAPFPATEKMLTFKEKPRTQKLTSEEEFLLQQAKQLENEHITHERYLQEVQISKENGFFIPAERLPPEWIGSSEEGEEEEAEAEAQNFTLPREEFQVREIFIEFGAEMIKNGTLDITELPLDIRQRVMVYLKNGFIGKMEISAE